MNKINNKRKVFLNYIELIPLLLIIFCVQFGGCIRNNNKLVATQINSYDCVTDKITFDLNKIPDNGLVGPADGQVTLDYEFCIPNEDQYIQEIKKISPKIMQGSSGRIGCTKTESLCIGNTGTKDFKIILCKLSTLKYIKKITLCHWE